DISEDGALIRVGGAGKSNVRIKLQFDLNGSFIMMYGVVRGVEYNKDIEQSRLHFECTHIDATMKNAILAFVYNVLPENEKEINEAMAESENDEKEDEMEQIVTGRSEEKIGSNVEVVKSDEIQLGAESSQTAEPDSHGSSFFGMEGVEPVSTSTGFGSNFGSGVGSIPMESLPEASNLDVMPGDAPQFDNPEPKASPDSGGI
ncbi:MAG: PilZ domain-containing protein, partial [Treponema sp.]|nr:PilZ domain-containing protein [Treponema sp.]